MSEGRHDTDVVEVVLQLKHQLGRLLQRRRFQLGMTQRDLSDAAKISLKYLGEIERGEANPTLDMLARLACVLDWDPWTLFGARQPAISRNTHSLITADLGRAQQQLGSLSAWLDGLNPTIRGVPADETTAVEAHDTVPATAPRRRGRPRMRHIVRGPRP